MNPPATPATPSPPAPKSNPARTHGVLRAAAFSGIILAGLTLGGCHYQVTDPQSGKVFYTTHLDRNKHNGSVEFKDAITGQEVTLQNSEVKDISGKEFKQATGK